MNVTVKSAKNAPLNWLFSRILSLRYHKETTLDAYITSAQRKDKVVERNF